MGHKIAQFRDSDVAEDFICSICKEIFKDPVTGACDHIFCRECIEEWINNKEHICPIDRNNLNADDLKQVPRYFKNLLEKLAISCKFAKQGCTFEIRLENIDEIDRHQNVDCSFHPKREVQCDKLNGCNLTVLRENLEKHDCIVLLKETLQQNDVKIASGSAKNDDLMKQNCRLQQENTILKRELRSFKDQNSFSDLKIVKMKRFLEKMTNQFLEINDEMNRDDCMIEDEQIHDIQKYAKQVIASSSSNKSAIKSSASCSNRNKPITPGGLSVRHDLYNMSVPEFTTLVNGMTTSNDGDRNEVGVPDPVEINRLTSQYSKNGKRYLYKEGTIETLADRSGPMYQGQQVDSYSPSSSRPWVLPSSGIEPMFLNPRTGELSTDLDLEEDNLEPYPSRPAKRQRPSNTTTDASFYHPPMSTDVPDALISGSIPSTSNGLENTNENSSNIIYNVLSRLNGMM